jgi:hypothetical protein
VTAFAAASAARRELLGTQESRTHRDRWLTRASGIAAGAAYAEMCLGRLARAAAALDGGRALTLSEQLEVRAVAGRLRAGDRNDLADRYERATLRYAELAASRRRAARNIPSVEA